MRRWPSPRCLTLAAPFRRPSYTNCSPARLRSLRELGVVLAGGHTTEGSESGLGFAVTGHAETTRLFQKNQLQIGDVLMLTKPLGSGALLAAWMRGACQAAWFEKLACPLLLANQRAAAIFDEAGMCACTDVTGFGLAGHLLEMLDASRVSVRLHRTAVPLYDGFVDVVTQGIVSSLHADNAKLSCRIQGASPLPEWLFDPQTSGGLLAAVSPRAHRHRVATIASGWLRERYWRGEIIPADPAPLIELK